MKIAVTAAEERLELKLESVTLFADPSEQSQNACGNSDRKFERKLERRRSAASQKRCE